MGKPLIDRTGHKYGRLTVTGRAENYRGNARWICTCECGSGKRVVALGNDLKRGKVKSCGCWNAEKIVRHGMSQTHVYHAWQGMIQRCENPKEKAFKHYGARGITVCEAWHDFEQFFHDMGSRPKGYSLDRIDNDGSYESGNCRWATTKQQLNNQRRNRIVELNGRKQTLMQWAEELGVDWYTLRSRIDRYSWTIEDALTKPVGRSGHNRNVRRLTHEGRTHTLAEWAKESGVGYEVLRKRLGLGWSLERALSTPVRRMR